MAIVFSVAFVLLNIPFAKLIDFSSVIIEKCKIKEMKSANAFLYFDKL